FVVFGPLTIFQSDNGKEFTAEIIRDVTNLWPGVKIINGRPRHPQSQGCIEQANGVLSEKLAKWMEDGNRSDWASGLSIVTCKIRFSFNCTLTLRDSLHIDGMNTQKHSAIGKTPYEVVFVQEPRLNTVLLEQLWKQDIRDEKNLPRFSRYR